MMKGVYYLLILVATGIISCGGDSIKEGLDAQRRYKTYSINGRILNGDTGVSQAAVTLSDSDDNIILQSTTDSAGNYSLMNIISGTYTITPSKNGCKFSPESREVTVNQADTQIDFSGRYLYSTEFQKHQSDSLYIVAGEEFGYSVDINGDYIISGARKDTEGDSGDIKGAAYIFRQTGETSWNYSAKLSYEGSRDGDEFGYSVALTAASGRNYALIGSPGYDGSDGTLTDIGSAFIYLRTDTDKWDENIFQLTCPTCVSGDEFGYAVDINGNYAVIGAPFTNSKRGGVYIFNRTDINIWSNPGNTMIIHPDAAGGDFFGNAVAIDGDNVIIGAKFKTLFTQYEGAAYIYRQTGINSWTITSKLICPDAGTGDEFGYSVDIFGDYAVVGAPFKNENGPERGAAYIFKRISGYAWSAQTKLTAPDSADEDSFGISVAINGNYAIIGANKTDSEDSITGSVYVFFRNDSDTWEYLHKLIASDAESGDEFGFSAAMDEFNLVVGASKEDTEATDAGAIYVY